MKPTKYNRLNGRQIDELEQQKEWLSQEEQRNDPPPLHGMSKVQPAKIRLVTFWDEPDREGNDNIFTPGVASPTMFFKRKARR